MKTNKTIALLSALSLTIIAQPAYGMEQVKNRFKESNIARFAAVATFVGLVTGNKKWAAAGACALALTLAPKPHPLKVAEFAFNNWQVITGTVAFASLCYTLWQQYNDTSTASSDKEINEKYKNK